MLILNKCRRWFWKSRPKACVLKVSSSALLSLAFPHSSGWRKTFPHCPTRSYCCRLFHWRTDTNTGYYFDQNKVQLGWCVLTSDCIQRRDFGVSACTVVVPQARNQWSVGGAWSWMDTHLLVRWRHYIIVLVPKLEPSLLLLNHFIRPNWKHWTSVALWWIQMFQLLCVVLVYICCFFLYWNTRIYVLKSFCHHV